MSQRKKKPEDSVWELIGKILVGTIVAYVVFQILVGLYFFYLVSMFN